MSLVSFLSCIFLNVACASFCFLELCKFQLLKLENIKEFHNLVEECVCGISRVYQIHHGNYFINLLNNKGFKLRYLIMSLEKHQGITWHRSVLTNTYFIEFFAWTLMLMKFYSVNSLFVDHICGIAPNGILLFTFTFHGRFDTLLQIPTLVVGFE